MALTITTTITVSDDEAYTAREAAILAALQAHPSQGAAAVVPAVEKPAPKARTPKAAPAPETAASTTPAVLDTTLDEPEDDLVGGEEPAKEYTLDDAVTLATQLVSDGKSAVVKAALAAAGGAKRVSVLKGAAITTFITAAQA